MIQSASARQQLHLFISSTLALTQHSTSDQSNASTSKGVSTSAQSNVSNSNGISTSAQSNPLNSNGVSTSAQHKDTSSDTSESTSSEEEDEAQEDELNDTISVVKLVINIKLKCIYLNFKFM